MLWARSNPGTRLLALLLLLCSGLALAVPQSAFSFYKMPTAIVGPCDICYGVDGNIWVQDQLSSKIAVVFTDTGRVKELAIPYKNAPLLNASLPSIDGKDVLACAIQPGADGMMYASAGTRNEIVQIDPKTYAVRVFSEHNLLGDLQPFNDLYRAKDAMWFTQTTGNLITRFDYKTHELKNYAIPTPLSGPLGLYVTPDGAIWVAEFAASKMLRLNATTGHMVEYPCPLFATQPAVIRAFEEPYLYFTATTGGGIAGINIHTGAFVTYPNTQFVTTPTVDSMDGRGRVWYTSLSDNLLSVLDLARGGTYTEVVTPLSANGSVAPPALVISVAYGKRQNSMFYTQEAGNFVGRIQLA